MDGSGIIDVIGIQITMPIQDRMSYHDIVKFFKYLNNWYVLFVDF